MPIWRICKLQLLFAKFDVSVYYFKFSYVQIMCLCNIVAQNPQLSPLTTYRSGASTVVGASPGDCAGATPSPGTNDGAEVCDAEIYEGVDDGD